LIGQALLNVETEKLRLLQNKEKAPIEKPLDKDRCFFESILPHVQKLSPLRKLQFRSQVQELVISYGHMPTCLLCCIVRFDRYDYNDVIK
jgi:hypothetical protein